MERCVDVVIAGGGLAGLSCAVALCNEGLKVSVLEAGDCLGGRARSCPNGFQGDRTDLGPHIILTEYPNFLGLLRQLGTDAHIDWQRDRIVTLRSQQHTTTIKAWRLPAPLHLLPGMLSARDVSLRHKLSNGRAVWLGMRFVEDDVPHLDSIPADQWLSSLGVSGEFCDWFWRSVSMALMNVPLERCSSAALMRFFHHFLGRPDGRFGFPEGPLEDLFVPGARQVIARHGGTIRLGARVTALDHFDQRCRGVVLADGSTIKARHCVLCLPPGELLKILPEPWKRIPPFTRLDKFEPSPYISVYLWFDRKLTRERFWAGTWTPTRLNYDFYDLSNIRAGRKGNSLIASNIVHSQRAEHLDDEAIVAATLREIQQFLPQARVDQVVHWQVHHIGMAVPCPLPGTETARPGTRTPLEGLWLAGDWTRTALPCSMESAVRSGLLAAEGVLLAQGRHRSLAQMPRPPSGVAGLVEQVLPGIPVAAVLDSVRP